MSQASPPASPVNPPNPPQLSAPGSPEAPIDLAAQREQRRQERATRRAEMQAALNSPAPQAPKQNQAATPPEGGVAKVAGVAKAKTWLESQPTPGGIGALVTGLILLMILVFPVTSADGTKTTRAGLLWGVLVGKARVAGEQGLVANETAGAAGVASVAPGSTGSIGPVAPGLNAPITPGTFTGGQGIAPPNVNGPLGSGPAQPNPQQILTAPDGVVSSPMEAVSWLPFLP